MSSVTIGLGMADLWIRVEVFARQWLESLLPIVPEMTSHQRLFLGAVTLGPHLLRNTNLSIDWAVFDHFVGVLRESPRFGQVAYYGTVGSTVRAEDIPGRLAQKSFDSQGAQVSEETISNLLHQLRSFMEDDEVKVTVRSELFGFWADAPVQIADNLAIVLNTAEPTLMTLMMAIPQGRYCLEANATVNLRFQPERDFLFDAVNNEDTRLISGLYSDVALACQILSILDEGSFTPGSPDLVFDNWLLSSGFQSRPLRPVYPTSFDRFDLKLSHADLLKTLFSTARKLREDGPNHVLVALNRFYLAQFRGSFDDRLLDLVIAAEAMFLNDANGELSYRLATRGALFLADKSEERTAIFRKLRKAYERRNAIVHGSRIQSLEVAESVEDMEATMRVAVRKALVTIGAGHQSAVSNWDDLAFLSI